MLEKLDIRCLAVQYLCIITNYINKHRLDASNFSLYVLVYILYILYIELCIINIT